MIVAVSQPELEYTGRFDWINDGGNGWDLSHDTLKLSTIKFNVKASTDSIYHVTLRRHSFGRSEEEAEDRAGKIQYAVYSKDSVLDLASGYAIDKNSKFRGQQVEIVIEVPVGKRIRFDRSVDEKLNPTSFRIKRTYRRNRIVNISIDDDIYMNHFRSDVDYIMGIDGNLKDAEGKDLINNDYRYSNNNNDSIELKRSIEQKKQELKELEERQNKKQSFNEKESMDDKEDAVASASSPVFSLVRSFF
jgi:hypothetical protein